MSNIFFMSTNKFYKYNDHTPGHVAILTTSTEEVAVEVKGNKLMRPVTTTNQDDKLLSKDEVYELPAENEDVKRYVALGMLTETTKPEVKKSFAERLEAKKGAKPATTPVKPNSNPKPNGANATEVK